MQFVVRAAIRLGPGRSSDLKIFNSAQNRSKRLRRLSRSDLLEVESALSRYDRHLALVAFHDLYVARAVDFEDEQFHSKWLPGLLAAGRARNRTEALVRGHALRAWLPRSGDPLDLSAQSLDSEWLEGSLEDLFTLVSQPYGEGTDEAAQLAALAGLPAVELAYRHLSESPMGYRTLRVVNACVVTARDTLRRKADDREACTLLDHAGAVLRMLHRENRPCIYRSRSFWEEVASNGPHDWNVWLLPLLRERAIVGEPASLRPLPRRTRMYAAWILFSRLRPNDDPALLADVLDSFRCSDDGGLRFTADLIEWIRSGGRPEPPIPEDEDSRSFWAALPTARSLAESARECAREFDRLPDDIARGATRLVLQALLTPDGVLRRMCLEALNLVVPIESARVFRGVSEEATQSSEDSWATDLAAFGLGYMHARDQMDGLLEMASLPRRGEPTTDLTTRVTALMELGDLGSSLHEELHFEHEVLSRHLLDALRSQRLTFSEVRAAVYGLAMLRPVHEQDQTTSLLKKIVLNEIGYLEDREAVGSGERMRHDDWVSAALAQWALDRMSARDFERVHGQKPGLTSPLRSALNARDVGSPGIRWPVTTPLGALSL